MPSAVTPITSPTHLRTITSGNTYTVIDFYADWCGPCKVISPIFEQLAAQESKAGRLAFVKVDVDAQREVAGNYGVSA
jgi:thioredoxin 1